MTAKTRLARTATMLITVLATMAGVLVMVGVTAAPAQADYNPDAKYGYAKVIEPEAYLRHYVSKGTKVLHVDTEHMTSDGFWFAGKSGFSDRGFDWQYQPFGMWCGGSVQKVEWNPWMNTNACEINWDVIESWGPGTTANTATCRADSGHPWKKGYEDPHTYCDNSALTVGAEQESGHGYFCAPWEDQGVTSTGSAKCLGQRYAWESSTPNSFWSPAPDTCTGLPENASKVYVNPDLYVPAGPVPDCTGEALASNCPAGSVHQACTGVPQTAPAPIPFTATSTSVGVVTDGVGTASGTATATRNGIAYRVTKTAKARYAGKVYKARKTIQLTRSATKTVTTSVTVTNGNARSSSTASCTVTGPVAAAEARVCAETKARAEAIAAARIVAEVEATTRAATYAAQAARQQAEAAATAAAQAVPVAVADQLAAVKKAKKQAVRAVKKKIAKAKKRRR